MLNDIYRSYYPVIQVFILNNSGSDEDAKDLFQEALVSVFRKIRSEEHFVLTSSFKTYLYSVARHLWLKQLRKIKSEPLRVIDVEAHFEITPPHPGTTVEDAKRSLFQKHLKKLPEDCQQIIRLSMKEVPQKKIAERLGFSSEDYVKKRKHYCKAFLMESIRKDPEYRDLLDQDELGR